LLPVGESCSRVRVATRTIGTITDTASRSVTPSSALMGSVRRSCRTLNRPLPRLARNPESPLAVRTSCSIRATLGIAAEPTVSPVSGAPNGCHAVPLVYCRSQVMMRGSTVTRSVPRRGMSVRSTA